MNAITATNTAKAFNALNTFGTTVKGAAEKLRSQFEQLGIDTVEQTFEIVTAWAAKRSGCPLVAGKRGKAAVLDSSHPAYEAAKTARRRVMDVFEPKERKESAKPSGHKVPVVTPELRKQTLAYLEQFDGKDRAAKIREAIRVLRSLV